MCGTNEQFLAVRMPNVQLKFDRGHGGDEGCQET